MYALVSNDDGIEARGLQILADVASELGTVSIVAPDAEQSAQSHALTMHMPLRVVPAGPRRWAVNGTPADCVYLAVHHLLDREPDLVLSGVNHGANLGNDVFYSGTVAAAMEACLHGYPAIAFSLYLEPGQADRYWDTVSEVVRQVIAGVTANPLPRRVMLNVNIPNLPSSELRGLRTTRLGERAYAPLVALRTDPRGRQYFWIGGDPVDADQAAGTDGAAIHQGWATITPLRADLTSEADLDAVRSWANG